MLYAWPVVMTSRAPMRIVCSVAGSAVELADDLAARRLADQLAVASVSPRTIIGRIRRPPLATAA